MGSTTQSGKSIPDLRAPKRGLARPDNPENRACGFYETPKAK